MNFRKELNKVLCLIISAVMIIGMLPLQAFADEPGDHEHNEIITEPFEKSEGEEGPASEHIGEENTPAQGEENVPTEGEETVPTEGGENVPTEGEENVPSEGEETVPTEGEENDPTEGEENDPTEGEETVPTEGEETVPTEGGETAPSQSENALESSQEALGVITETIKYMASATVEWELAPGTYTFMQDDDDRWEDETLVVRNDVVIDNEYVGVHGAVVIILEDGASLTVSEGIYVPEGESLFIYGQKNSTGKLTTR